MHSILVHEHVSGGGYSDHALPRSLLREGRAMRDAFVEDFALVAGLDVTATNDARLEPVGLPCRVASIDSPEVLTREIAARARDVDAVLVIAPEIEGALLTIARTVVTAGGTLVGGSLEAIEIAADKLRLTAWLERAGVATIEARACANGDVATNPVVVKPRWGAGSEGVFTLPAGSRVPLLDLPSVITPLCSGLAASVLCLAGPDGVLALPPCAQRLSNDGRFAYRGGDLPLAPAAGRHCADDEALRCRARDLAVRAVESLPDARGFFGVDLLLALDEHDDGASPATDRVVEINPRATTSYCGLRAATDANLALLGLEHLRGGSHTTPVFRDEPIRFASDGTISTRSDEALLPGAPP